MNSNTATSIIYFIESQVKHGLQVLTKVGWSLEINVGILNNDNPYNMSIRVKSIMVQKRPQGGWGNFDYEYTITMHYPPEALEILELSTWIKRITEKANSHVRWDKQPK